MWSLDAQMTTALPLRVAELTGNPRAVGPLSTLNSLLIIFLQVPISVWLLRRLHPLNAMAAGILLTGAGLASVAWAGGPVHLAGSVAIIALGQMLYVPTIDSTVSTFARGESIGAFFGLATLVWGLGTATGNLVGGQAMAAAGRLGSPGLPWFLFAGLAVVAAIGLAVLRRWPAMRAALREETEGTRTGGAPAPAAVRWEPEPAIREDGLPQSIRSGPTPTEGDDR